MGGGAGSWAGGLIVQGQGEVRRLEELEADYASGHGQEDGN